MNILVITGIFLIPLTFIFILYITFFSQAKFNRFHPFFKEIRVLEYIENNFENLSYMAVDDTNEHMLYDDNLTIYVEIRRSWIYEEGLVPNKVLRYFYRRNEINLDCLNSDAFLFGDLGERYKEIRKKVIKKLDENVIETLLKRKVRF